MFTICVLMSCSDAFVSFQYRCILSILLHDVLSIRTPESCSNMHVPNFETMRFGSHLTRSERTRSFVPCRCNLLVRLEDRLYEI